MKKKNKYLKLLIVFFIFIFIIVELVNAVDTIPPNVTSLRTDPASPVDFISYAHYTNGRTFEFNATVKDDTGIHSSNSVILTFNGVNYSSNNLSITPTVFTALVYNISVGTYSYFWVANDTSGNINNSEAGTYVVKYPSGSSGDITWNSSDGDIVNTSGTNWILFNNTAVISTNVSLYSNTNTLLYNFTSICNGSSSNIGSNDGDITIHLRPSEHCYVLNSFNLTEGVSRDNSPLWFSLNSSTSKHIASNLTNTINTTIVILVTSQPSSITYVSDTGAFSYTLTSSNWTYDSSANTITLNLNGIEYSSSSNILTISYPASQSSGGGGDSKINYNLSTQQNVTNQNYTITPKPFKSLQSIFDKIKNMINIKKSKVIYSLLVIIVLIVVVLITILILLINPKKRRKKKR